MAIAAIFAADSCPQRAGLSGEPEDRAVSIERQSLAAVRVPLEIGDGLRSAAIEGNGHSHVVAAIEIVGVCSKLARVRDIHGAAARLPNEAPQIAS